MPSVSQKQANFMRMCMSSAGRKKAKKKCPPKKVARHYVQADRRLNRWGL